MTSLWILFAAGLMLVAPGCQGPGVARDEIPEDPIAFIFHPEAEARRRAEVYAKRATAAVMAAKSAARSPPARWWRATVAVTTVAPKLA